MNYFSMAIGLTVVKAGAQLMLDILEKNPDIRMPEEWPFMSMDEFVAEVDRCTEFYKEQATLAAIQDAMERIKREEG